MSATLTALMTELQTRITAATTSTPNSDLVNLAVSASGLGLNTSNLTTVLNTKIAAINDSTALTDILLLKKAAMVNPEAVIGQVTQGQLQNDVRYLLCNGGTKLVANYPEIPTALLNNLGTQLEAAGTSSPTKFPILSTDMKLAYDGTYYYNYNVFSVAPNQNGPFNLYKSTDQVTWTQVTSIPGCSNVSYYWSAQLYDMTIVGTYRHIAAMVTINGVSKVGLISSLDSGATWHYNEITTMSTNGGIPRISAIGNTLVLANTKDSINNALWYSLDAGLTWSQCTAAAATGHNAYALGNNGSRWVVYYSDNSTAYTTGTDPSGANWTAVAAATTAITAFQPQETISLSGKVILLGQGTNSMYTSTDCIAWTKQTTFNTAMQSAGTLQRTVLVGTRLFMLVQNGSNYYLYYVDNATTFTAPTQVVVDSKLTTNYLLNALNSDGTNVYAVWNGIYVYKSATGASGSWSVIGNPYVGAGGYQYQNCMIKKYGVLLFSTTVGVTTGSATYGSTARHYSTDNGVTWLPCATAIVFGAGTIIDCGTRLLCMGTNQVLYQSTDGLTWNTTGITQPTIPGANNNPYHGRLFRVNTGTYMLVARDNTTTWYWYFSANDGSTWNASNTYYGADLNSVAQSIAPFMYWNGNYYYLHYLYVSGSPAMFNCYLFKSANGYSWTQMYFWNANYTNSDGLSGYGAQLIVHDNVLYASCGSYVGSNPYTATSIVASYDGTSAYLMTSVITVPSLVLGLIYNPGGNSNYPRYEYGTSVNTYSYTTVQNPVFTFYRPGNNSTVTKIKGTFYQSAFLIDGANYRYFNQGTETLVPTTNVSFTLPTYGTNPPSYMRVAL